MLLRRTLGSLALTATLAGGVASVGCKNPDPSPRVQGQVHLTLIHTSDIHSRLFPYSLQLGQVDAGLGLGQSGDVVEVGGAARVSYIVGRERARASRVLHLDGGDCFQGAPIFNYFSGEAEIRAMSAMGTDAAIVANHEFDRGALNLGKQLQAWASYPVLAANYEFYDTKTAGASPLGSIVEPFTVFTLDGLRVGVVGMGNLSSITSIFDQPNKLSIMPLNTREVAQFYVDLLRPTVDVVVLVTHLGLDNDETMIANTTGIDVVLGGHNHIVLQPPKSLKDCSAHYDDHAKSYFVALAGPEATGPDAGCSKDSDCDGGFCESGVCKIKRYCRPRDVLLAHSGAFAKYVGRLDLVLSNQKKDMVDPASYDSLNNFEVISHEYRLFPVNGETPEDPIVKSTLEPYQQGLDRVAALDLLVGYALDGSKRNSTSGGDSPLGNMISTAMWLRLGIQTDFSLTNTTGIRADLVPGPITVEQMFNIFPFDNSITKMQLSGYEVQELFDFAARRSAGRGCKSQVQIAGARVVMDCAKQLTPDLPPGVATGIYIGASMDPDTNKPRTCKTDGDCPGTGKKCSKNADCDTDLCVGGECRYLGVCAVDSNTCWQPILPQSSYELATSNYLAAGGSGFRVLQRNTTQLDTGVQQRDALIDYIRAGKPCGADDSGALKGCSKDADCASVGDGFVCACPEAVNDDVTCSTNTKTSCSSGQCVLAQCRTDVADFQRKTCAAAPNALVRKQCEAALSPCAAAGETCKFLSCVDRRLGNYSDGRLLMVGQ
jgi:5'-nucleotidase